MLFAKTQIILLDKHELHHSKMQGDRESRCHVLVVIGRIHLYTLDNKELLLKCSCCYHVENNQPDE